MKKVAIIANGKLKKSEKLKEKLSLLLPEQYRVIDKITQWSGHATELALEAVNEGADFIIAVGGDGTFNEVVNGIMLANENQRQNIITGLFPMGTGNDFARGAMLTKSVNELAKLIQIENIRKIDLGLVEYTNEKGEIKKRYFDNIAEIGVGAKTVEIVNKSKKTLGSTLTFFLGVIKAFGGYKQQSIQLKTNEFHWEGKIVAVCIANGKYFGSGLGIAPGANLDDGKLSLVIVGNIRVLHFLRYLPNLRKLKLISHPEVHYRKIEACEIFGQEKYPFEMDGENVGFTPFSASVVPGAIRMLM